MRPGSRGRRHPSTRAHVHRLDTRVSARRFGRAARPTLTATGYRTLSSVPPTPIPAHTCSCRRCRQVAGPIARWLSGGGPSRGKVSSVHQTRRLVAPTLWAMSTNDPGFSRPVPGGTPPPPPVVSPDGKFWWDGQNWKPFGGQDNRHVDNRHVDNRHVDNRHVIANGVSAGIFRVIFILLGIGVALAMLGAIAIDTEEAGWVMAVALPAIGVAVWYFLHVRKQYRGTKWEQ